jgi:WD40 repeat protein
LYFTQQDDQLIVLREDAIERWELESDSVSTLMSNRNNGSESAPRWMGGAVSPEGKWLAIHDFDDSLQVVDLTVEANGRPLASSESMDQQVFRLLFGGQDDALIVVCESLPIYRALISESSDGKLQVRALDTAAETTDQIVVDAARLGSESTVVATKQSVFVRQADAAGPDDKFELWKSLDRPTISFLRATDNGGWFLVGTESDPSAYLWNLGNREPAFTVGTQQISAISEAVFSADGNWLAIASTKGDFKLLDLRESSPRLIDFQRFDDGYVQHLGFTADGRSLIAVVNLPGLARGRIYAWDFQRCWLVLDARAGLSE